MDPSTHPPTTPPKNTSDPESTRPGLGTHRLLVFSLVGHSSVPFANDVVD